MKRLNFGFNNWKFDGKEKQKRDRVKKNKKKEWLRLHSVPPSLLHSDIGYKFPGHGDEMGMRETYALEKHGKTWICKENA